MDESAFFSPSYQSGTAEMGKMERQGGRHHTYLLRDSAGVHAFRPGLDEQSEDGKTGIVTQSSKEFSSV